VPRISLRYGTIMTTFEKAKARADEIAPPPADKPLAAAATAFGFGLLVTGLFVALEWLGFPAWIAWLGSALAYGGIAYADCQLGWNRNKREYREAMEILKGEANAPSVH
jgi:hypothetical protein